MIFPNPITFFRSMLKAGLARVAGIPLTVPLEAQEARLTFCHLCPFKRGGQCLRCTCFILPKTLISVESCPMGYWDTYLTPRDSDVLFKKPWLLRQLQRLAIRMFKALG